MWRHVSDHAQIHPIYHSEDLTPSVVLIIATIALQEFSLISMTYNDIMLKSNCNLIINIYIKTIILHT